MVDIHCHILPGMDDSADTMETSVKMAEIAIARWSHARGWDAACNYI